VEFSSSEYVEDHYNQIHATQVCGFCGSLEINATALIQHEQEIHGHYTINKNYIGGAWDLWDHWMCEESIKKEVILSNVAYFHNYTSNSTTNNDDNTNTDKEVALKIFEEGTKIL
jgi:hypothetical protein